MRDPRPLLSGLALLLLAASLQGQLYTKKTGLIDEDRFNLDVRFEQFSAATDSRIFRTSTVIAHIGINPKMEMLAWFPFPNVTKGNVSQTALPGDILIDVKYQTRKGWYRLPFLQKEQDSIYYLNLYMGFNTATGPQQFNLDGLFFPATRGLTEVKFGVLFGTYTKHAEFFANLYHVYATDYGEKLLSFEDRAFFFPTASERSNGAKPIFLWNAHKVLLKFIWPGKIGGEWPFGNDYFEFNLAFNYWVEFKPIIFRYKFFIEMNIRKSYNVNFCLVPDQFQLTGGVTVRFFKGAKATLAASYPVYSQEFRNLKYTFGLMVSL